MKLKICKKFRLCRNAHYDNNLTTIYTNISTTHKLILPHEKRRGEKNIKSKDYYQKIMHHNTYIEVNNLALHLM